MSIPYKMRPTGFDSWYVRLQRDLLQLLGSSEKFELDWIAPEKKLIIHTDRVDTAVLSEVTALADELVPSNIEVVQYNQSIDIPWQEWQPGFEQIEYLESTAQQYINTGIYPNSNMNIHAIALTRVWNGTLNINPVFGCRGDISWMFSLNYNLGTDPQTPKTGAGMWGSSAVTYFYGNGFSTNTKYDIVWNRNILNVNDKLIKTFADEEFDKTQRVMYLFASNNGSPMYTSKVIYHFSVEEDGKELLNYVPAIDPSGTPCMFDRVTCTPRYSATSVSFIGGIDTQTQLDNVLQNLPDRTGQDIKELKIRLAEDLQTDANNAKLEAMQAKNWNIIQVV